MNKRRGIAWISAASLAAVLAVGLAGCGAQPAEPYLSSKLVPIVETEFTRTSWLMGDRTAKIEIALDEGEVRAGGKTSPIREIELELKAGEVEALHVLANWLKQQFALTEENDSKYARGLALRRG